jgi:hypothetical protein
LSEFEYLVFLRERYIQAEKWTEECIQTLKNNPDLEIKITEPKIFAAKPEIKRKKDVLIIKKK